MADRLAASLRFYPKPKEDQSQPDILIRAREDEASPPPLQQQTVLQSEHKSALTCKLLTVTACEALESDSRTVSQPIADAPLTPKDCQPLKSGYPPVMPLVRRQKLWPAVKRSLVVKRAHGVDISTLASRIARAEPVRCLPAMRRYYWSGCLTVVWDGSERMAPYFADYQALLNQLLTGRGSDGLTLLNVDSVPGQVMGCRPPKTGGDVSQAAKPAAGGGNVLILSDLGALSASSHAARQWQAYARSIRRAGGRVVAWVPHSPRQVEAETARLIKIYCLDSVGNLQPQTGRLRTVEQRETEHRRMCHLREQLLVRTAFCVRVEMPLLRAVRVLRPDTAVEPGLEGLVWSYRPVVRASEVSRPLAADYQAGYRALFRGLPVEEQQAALDCVLNIHDWQGRSTGVLETLIWESHVNGIAANSRRERVVDARAWIAAFRAARRAQGNTRELAEFAQDVLSRNWGDAVFQKLQSPWLSELWASSGLTEIPVGLLSSDLDRVGVSDDGRQSYRLVQVGSRLWLWPETEPLPNLAVSMLNVPRIFKSVEVATNAPFSRRRFQPNGERLPILEQVADQTCDLIHDGKRYHLSHLQRPAWAGRFGRDRCGIFAELLLTTENCTAAQSFRWIEPGTFLMGSPDDEPERTANEGPQHWVTLSRGYWLADTACTQALWLAVMGNNPSHFKSDPNNPVEQVSWLDVQQFLETLQALLPGCQADLPSEAEWEYACRAGTITPFSFGANIAPAQVNYHGNFPYAGGERGEYRHRTVPVKTLPANPWGLYEMHGNVGEWCKDGRREYGAAAQIDPLGPSGQDRPRVIRGGSWGHIARWSRSALRRAFQPDRAFNDLGFRLCLRSIGPGQAAGGPAGSPGRASGASPDAPGEADTERDGLADKLASIFKPDPKPKRRS
ncbi:formylglycine-generating enzyme family protein [Methylomonas sp. 2B]